MSSRIARLLRATLLAAPAASAFVLGSVSPARADNTATCIATNENSQKLRREKKLREALEELKICSQPTCPSAVQRDCTQWLREVEAALPSLSFSAKDGAGADLTDVRVDMDGQLILQQLDGSSVPVDPGKHTFTFSHEGDAEATQEILVSEGDKARKIEVRFKGGAKASAESPRHSAFPFVLGGVGVVGLITGTALFAVGKGRFPDECKEAPENADGLRVCGQGDTPNRANSAVTQSNIGIGLLVGSGVALAGGITWFVVEALATPSADTSARASRRRLQPRLVPSFGLTSVGVQGTF